MTSVADAFVTLRPSFDGFKQETERGLQGVAPAFKATGEAAGKAMDDASRKTSGLGDQLKKLAAAAAAALGAWASIKGLQSAVNVTTELGSAVSRLSRETGLAPESASKLLYTFKRMGLEGDDASRSLGFFSKNLLAVSDDAEEGDEALAPVSETLKALGINALDSAGNIRPMDKLLGELADKFKSMPDGAEKTALAMRIFGRTGKDLLPILNQGAAGLEALGKQAEKMGLVLSGKNVADIKKFTGAQRELGLAVAGVKLQIGLALMPALTFLSQKLIEVTLFARHLVENGLEFLKGKLIELKPQIDFVKEKFGELYDKLRPLVDKVLELGYAAITSTPGLAALGATMGLALLPVLGDALGVFANIAQTIALIPLNPLTILIGLVAGVAAGMAYLYTHSETVRKALDGLWDVVSRFATDTALPLLKGLLDDVGHAAHLLGLGLSGGDLQGDPTWLQQAAFDLGQTVRNDVIPFLKDVNTSVGLFIWGLRGGDIGGEHSPLQQAAFDLGKTIRDDLAPAVKDITLDMNKWFGEEVFGIQFTTGLRTEIDLLNGAIRTTIALSIVPLIASLKALGIELPETKVLVEGLMQAAILIGNPFLLFTNAVGALAQALRDLKNAAAELLGPLGKVIDVVNSIPSSISIPKVPSIGLHDVTSFIGGGIGQFRAAGGPVSMGQPYVVGERGPEWFVPRASGQVVPNGGLGGPSGFVFQNYGPIEVNEFESRDIRDIGFMLNAALHAEMLSRGWLLS